MQRDRIGEYGVRMHVPWWVSAAALAAAFDLSTSDGNGGCPDPNTCGFDTKIPLLLVLAGAGSAPMESAPRSAGFIQMSYELMPGYGFDVNYADAPYKEREALTRQLAAELVPEVFAAVGLDFEELTTLDGPGGYKLTLNPSLRTRLPLDWAKNTRLAAALGVVTYQWSMLLTDLTPSDAGNTGFGEVLFPPGTLDEALAEAFFKHAASVDPGLGGGFFALGDSMHFLNIVDVQGSPSSGLADESFIAALTQAAQSFAGAATQLGKWGKCHARFVENDWTQMPMGDAYWARLTDLPQANHQKLGALQAKYKTRFEDAIREDKPRPA